MAKEASTAKKLLAGALVLVAAAFATCRLWPRRRGPATHDTYVCPECGHVYVGRPGGSRAGEGLDGGRPPCPKCGARADTAALVRCIGCGLERVVVFPADAPKGRPLRVPPCPKCGSAEFAIIRRGDAAGLSELPRDRAAFPKSPKLGPSNGKP